MMNLKLIRFTLLVASKKRNHKDISKQKLTKLGNGKHNNGCGFFN